MSTATLEQTSLVNITTSRHRERDIEGQNENVSQNRENTHEFITIYCNQCDFKYQVMLNCGDRTCPICRRKWYGYHYEALKKIIKNWNEDLRVMELTIKNIPDKDFSKKSVKYLRKCLNRLLHRKYYKNKIKGGFYFVHLTNRGQGWHPHLHIIYRGEYIPQGRLCQDWYEITKDSYVVWIRRSMGIKKALQYLFGDLLQKPKIRSEDVWKYNEVLKGSRLIQGFGEYSKTGFREPFICPVCGNNCWICKEFELARFHRDINDTS